MFPLTEPVTSEVSLETAVFVIEELSSSGSLKTLPNPIDASSASSDSAAEESANGIAEPVEKTVRLAFRSGEALENVTLTLELPPNVELASWPGHRELSWQVSLNAGENVLSLPLKLLFPGAGELVARLDTGDRQKTFRAPIPEYPQRPVEDPES